MRDCGFYSYQSNTQTGAHTHSENTHNHKSSPSMWQTSKNSHRNWCSESFLANYSAVAESPPISPQKTPVQPLPAQPQLLLKFQRATGINNSQICSKRVESQKRNCLRTKGTRMSQLLFQGLKQKLWFIHMWGCHTTHLVAQFSSENKTKKDCVYGKRPAQLLPLKGCFVSVGSKLFFSAQFKSLEYLI